MMTNELVEIGGFLFAKAKSVFEYSDELDNFVAKLEQAIENGIDTSIAQYDEQFAWLREKACNDFKDIENKINDNKVLFKLESAFKESEVSSTFEAVNKMEREIIERSGYRSTEVAEANIKDMLKQFGQSLQQLEAEIPDDAKTPGKLTPFSFTQATQALSTLHRAQEILCSPGQVIMDRSQKVKHIKGLARIGRHVGVFTADVAGFCCGFTDMTGLLLFTSAKSVITSTRGIDTELRALKHIEADTTQPSADRENSVTTVKKRKTPLTPQRVKEMDIKKITCHGRGTKDSNTEDGD